MKITDRCYAIYGLTTIPPWMVNAGFIVGSRKTLIIDTGYNYLSAQTIHGYALAAAPENELVALNTEPHSDHMGGNCFFRELGIDVYGHEDIHRPDEDLAAVKAAYNASIQNPVRRDHHEENVVFTKTRFVDPNIAVSEDIAIDLSDTEVQILLTPGHTPMNISVFVPTDGVLFSGDTLISGYIPHLAEGTPEDWEDWLSSLEKLKSLSVETVVPGHGEVIRGPRIGKTIEETEATIRRALESGQPPAP